MARAASDSIVWDRKSDRTLLYAIIFIVGSVAVHVAGFALLDRYLKARPAPVYKKPMELVMIDVPPPKPVEEPKKEEPPPPPPPKKVKPPPVKVAAVKPVEIPKEDLPPPPNETPKEETPAKVVPIVVGISMSSTTANGAFAAPVGNTMYGKTADKAVKAEDVKAYVAPKYVPSYQLDTAPEPLVKFKVPYPEQARRDEIEGEVLLRVTLDATGAVTEVKVLRGVGHGLDEAAVEALKKSKFKPATKGGEPVGTSFDYSFNWELP